MQRINNSDELSPDDKLLILREISDTLYSMQEEYCMSVQRDLYDIEFSIDERISKVEDVAQQRGVETFR